MHVSDSSDLRRILAIPARDLPSHDRAQELARALTQALKTEHGTMSLFPTQAIALLEIATHRGGYLPIVVGGGKTLITLLAPVVLKAKRPLLLVPANLRDKTNAELPHYREHFKIAEHMRIESYSMLAGKNHVRLIEDYAPDLIICDESHALKNPSSAAKKRVHRYIKAHPEVAFVALTGTSITRSIREEAHILEWALRDRSPMPRDWHVIDEWSRALDVRVESSRRLFPGALRKLPGGESGDVRVAYRNRFLSIGGIVPSLEAPFDIPIDIEVERVEAPAELDKAWEDLRMGQTPDGWECADAIEIWRHARELGLGGYYVWDPRPPMDWRIARSAWAKASREIIAHNNRSIDTEAQAREATVEGHYPKHIDALSSWLGFRDSFTPNVQARWISPHFVDRIKRDMRESKDTPTIYWVQHKLFGEMLAKETGMRFFSQNASDSEGMHIMNFRESCIASVRSCGTGQNLQHYSRNVFCGALQNNNQWEQTIGRTHRQGQSASAVRCLVLLTCIEDELAIYKSQDEARFVRDMRGEQRLNRAAFSGLKSPASRMTAQWKK